MASSNFETRGPFIFNENWERDGLGKTKMSQINGSRKYRGLGFRTTENAVTARTSLRTMWTVASWACWYRGHQGNIQRFDESRNMVSQLTMARFYHRLMSESMIRGCSENLAFIALGNGRTRPASGIRPPPAERPMIEREYVAIGMNTLIRHTQEFCEHNDPMNAFVCGVAAVTHITEDGGERSEIRHWFRGSMTELLRRSYVMHLKDGEDWGLARCVGCRLRPRSLEELKRGVYARITGKIKAHECPCSTPDIRARELAEIMKIYARHGNFGMIHPHDRNIVLLLRLPHAYSSGTVSLSVASDFSMGSESSNSNFLRRSGGSSSSSGYASPSLSLAEMENPPSLENNPVAMLMQEVINAEAAAEDACHAMLPAMPEPPPKRARVEVKREPSAPAPEALSELKNRFAPKVPDELVQEVEREAMRARGAVTAPPPRPVEEEDAEPPPPVLDTRVMLRATLPDSEFRWRLMSLEEQRVYPDAFRMIYNVMDMRDYIRKTGLVYAASDTGNPKEPQAKRWLATTWAKLWKTISGMPEPELVLRVEGQREPVDVTNSLYEISWPYAPNVFVADVDLKEKENPALFDDGAPKPGMPEKVAFMMIDLLNQLFMTILGPQMRANWAGAGLDDRLEGERAGLRREDWIVLDASRDEFEYKQGGKIRLMPAKISLHLILRCDRPEATPVFRNMCALNLIMKCVFGAITDMWREEAKELCEALEDTSPEELLPGDFPEESIFHYIFRGFNRKAKKIELALDDLYRMYQPMRLYQCYKVDYGPRTRLRRAKFCPFSRDIDEFKFFCLTTMGFMEGPWTVDEGALPASLRMIDVVNPDENWPGATFDIRGGALVGLRMDNFFKFGTIGGKKRPKKARRGMTSGVDVPMGGGGMAGGSIGLSTRVPIADDKDSYAFLITSMLEIDALRPFMEAIVEHGKVFFEPVRLGDSGVAHRFVIRMPKRSEDPNERRKQPLLENLWCPIAHEVHEHVRPDFLITNRGGGNVVVDVGCFHGDCNGKRMEIGQMNFGSAVACTVIWNKELPLPSEEVVHKDEEAPPRASPQEE